MPATFSYQACGLSVASNAPIAGLRVGLTDRPCDLTIAMRSQRGTARRPHSETASIWYESPEREESGASLLTVWADADGYLLQYSEGASFLVDPSGGHVEVHWTSPLTDADVATYLLGPIMAFILRLRGTVPLHASAVAIEDRGVLFVGDAGAGKSSTVAAFATLGHRVLSDDIVPIAPAGDGVLAHPSHPRLSVWSDSAAVLLAAPESLPFHSPSYPKLYLDILEAGYGFQRSPVPIDVIYILGDRSAALRSPSSRPLGPRAALLALVRNTYCNYLLDSAMRAREFDVLSRLVRQVPVRELSFRDSLAHLSLGCQALVRDAQKAMVG